MLLTLRNMHRRVLVLGESARKRAPKVMRKPEIIPPACNL